jgi:ribosomal protein S27AE
MNLFEFLIVSKDKANLLWYNILNLSWFWLRKTCGRGAGGFLAKHTKYFFASYTVK